MTYSPTTWQTGDLITAALMNNLETQYSLFNSEYGPLRASTLSTSNVILCTSTLNFLANNRIVSASDWKYGFVGKLQIPYNYQPSRGILSFSITSTNAVNTDVWVAVFTHPQVSTGYLSPLDSTEQIGDTIIPTSSKFITSLFSFTGGEIFEIFAWPSASSKPYRLNYIQILASATTPTTNGSPLKVSTVGVMP